MAKLFTNRSGRSEPAAPRTLEEEARIQAELAAKALPGEIETEKARIRAELQARSPEEASRRQAEFAKEMAAELQAPSSEEASRQRAEFAKEMAKELEEITRAAKKIAPIFLDTIKPIAASLAGVSAASRVYVEAVGTSLQATFKEFDRRTREQQAAARSAFVEEIIARQPKKDRPDASGRADLSRRLLEAVEPFGSAFPNDSGLEAIDKSADPLVVRELAAFWKDLEARFRENGWWPERVSESEFVEEGVGDGGPAPLKDADPFTLAALGLAPRTLSPILRLFPFQIDFGPLHRLFLALVWKKVWSEYRAERVPPGAYQFPMRLFNANRAIGGKRHGAAHGLPAIGKGDPSTRRVVRLTVEVPKGAQVELGIPPRMTTIPADYDESGNLKPSAVLDAIAQVTGPERSIMGHVAFRAAFEDAVTEGRAPDGRFWWTPTRGAEMLGYGKESSGAGRGKKISKGASKALGERWAGWAGTILRETVERPDGSCVDVNGTLAYRTEKTETETTPGKGRKRREEWRIRDELWELCRTNYVLLPAAFIHAGSDRPDRWAHCVRVGEVLLAHARVNAPQVRAGKALVLSLATLAQQANVTEGERDDRTERYLWSCIDRLVARGFFTAERHETANGLPGVRFLPTVDLAAPLAEVANRAEAKRLGTPKPAPSRRRKKAPGRPTK